MRKIFNIQRSVDFHSIDSLIHAALHEIVKFIYIELQCGDENSLTHKCIENSCSSNILCI